VVAPTAKKYHGVVKATVATPTDGGPPAVSVVSAAPDRAVVLLFVNQVTESTRLSGPRLDLNRVRMTLTRTSRGWKVSGVDAL
jgi:Mce-associated membrane protein